MINYMKKPFKSLTIILLISIIMIAPTISALGISYTFVDIGLLGTKYTNSGPGSNSTYAEIYHVVSSGNSHKITLQTYYNGSWVAAGSTVDIAKGGSRQINIEYAPTSINYCRNEFDITAVCDGKNTTSSYCTKKGSNYRIKIKNNSAVSKLSVVGWTN